MSGRHPLTLSTIIVLCGAFMGSAFGLTAGPALAKKTATEAVKIQKQKKREAAKDCRRGPVPPFMRNPRFMNRGFLKKKC